MGLKNIRLNRKAFFYSISAIALIVVILITYGRYSSYSINERMNIIESRVSSLNFFIKDIEKDLEKGAFIAGFRTILSFNEYITTNGTYIDDVHERFKESFINGTIHGQTLNLMENSTFTAWAQRISSQADRIDIDFNFTLEDVILSQNDPWWITINLNLTLYVSDRANTSRWERNKMLTTRMSIIGFEDPLYIVNSQGKVTNLVTRTNVTQFVVGTDPQRLVTHANYSYYAVRNGSPSFLMRFEGDLGNSTYGIESLVNVDEFEQQGFVAKDRSSVDYIYFGSQTTTDYRVNNTQSWLKIDEDHLDFYGATNIICAPAQCLVVS